MNVNGRSDVNQAFIETDFLDGANATYLAHMLACYLQDPSQVPEDWRDFFYNLDEISDIARKNASGPSWKTALMMSIPNGAAEAGVQNRAEPYTRQATQDSLRALMLIRAYRMRGHLIAHLDPLDLAENKDHPELHPVTYGFHETDYDREIFIDGVLGLETATLRQILEIIRRTYCSTFGVQFMHVSDPDAKSWIQARIEGPDKEISFTSAGRVAILAKLIEAEQFEQFIHRRFPGTKRFGLDGGEALIPALEQIIKRGGALGLKDINFGMPHRGRLNVLAAVMKKPYRAIFHEFLGGDTSGTADFGSGDVKYHLGASSDRAFDGNEVHLSLAPNPSHLEIVNPVVIGKARAKQQMRKNDYEQVDLQSVTAVLLHGDAAFAGQGIVAECLAMSDLIGYRIGGTIHIIVNNQIGFTTSPKHSRSGAYSSDIALMVETPIFHVNADDPEAVTFAARVATEYRQKFQKDVIIDMICYRRYGHNEGDDPSFTQPLMYKKIKNHLSAREIYGQRLVADGLISQAEYEKMVTDFKAYLEAEFETAREYKSTQPDWLDGVWAGLSLPSEDDKRRGDTAVPVSRLEDIGRTMTEIPGHVKPHRTLKKIMEQRRVRIEQGTGIDWALAEHLAFGTLVSEGHPVRLSGQDCARGTFSQRHSRIIHQENENQYVPLNHLTPDQAYYQVIDSLLSEEAVLGFEYGFSITAPETLTIWEAQFGDFANGAQVIFDQFISSAEQKWLRMSGLVVMLPHGYEGQGPEHSSARLERYLQLCAEDNMQVANCTTPANYFHILRRQLHRNFRKPLILLTPKSLLRHKLCVSSLAEMGEGSCFHRVLWDDADYKPHESAIQLVPDAQIKKVLLCSGKIYYDLFEERARRQCSDIYILRVEQLYPYPASALEEELGRFPAADMIWVQEEPKNMGGWHYINPHLEESLTKLAAKMSRPDYVGRSASASTATGLALKHKAELQAIFEALF